MVDSSVDLPRPSADEANVNHIPNGQSSSVAIVTEPREKQARGHLGKNGLALSLYDDTSILPLDKISLDEVPPEKDMFGNPVDPVVGRRIREETDYLRARLDKINQGIEDLERVQSEEPSVPWHKRVLGGLTGRKSLPGEPVVDPVAWDLNYQRQVVESELGWKPRDIREQIEHNRKSRQLYPLMRFLGDEPSGNMQDYYYDAGGVPYPREEDLYRRFKDLHQVLWALNLRGARIRGYSGGVITLYDTSQPRPQMTIECFVDAMLKFGFASDLTLQHSMAVPLADTGLDPEALDKFGGGEFGSDNSFGKMMGEKEWLHVLHDGKSANGFLHIEGDQEFDPTTDRSDSPNLSPALSELCREWGFSHLSADLIYTRIPTGDVSIVVEFRNPSMESEESPVAESKLLAPGFDSLPAGLKNVTPKDSE